MPYNKISNPSNMEDLKSKSKAELVKLCKERNIKGYSGKKKDDIVSLLKKTILENKRDKGQFYTTRYSYILEGFDIPQNITNIIEPFAGKGDLIEWIKKTGYDNNIEAYDIEPKKEFIEQRDTLINAFRIFGSPSICLAAVRQNGGALEFVPKELKRDVYRLSETDEGDV